MESVTETQAGLITKQHPPGEEKRGRASAHQMALQIAGVMKQPGHFFSRPCNWRRHRSLDLPNPFDTMCSISTESSPHNRAALPPVV
jgi:hypothetical protein